MRRISTDDAADVKRCDTFIRWTDNEAKGTAELISRRLLSGGKLEETGMALAWGKRVIVVGGFQNIFDRLSVVQHVKDFAELVQTLELFRVAA